jgi:hypothetical protein
LICRRPATFFLALSFLTCPSLLSAANEISLFDFEAEAPLAWSWTGPLVSSLKLSKDQAYEGKGSLAIAVSASGGASLQATLKAASGLEALGPGSLVSFRLWIPKGAAFSGFEPYSYDSGGHWNGVWTGAFKSGEWNLFTHRVPCDASLPITELGLYLFGSGDMQGNIYLDGISALPGSSGAKERPKPLLRPLKELP